MTPASLRKRKHEGRAFACLTAPDAALAVPAFGCSVATPARPMFGEAGAA